MKTTSINSRTKGILFTLFAVILVTACSGTLQKNTDDSAIKAVSVKQLIPHFDGQTRLSEFYPSAPPRRLANVGTNASGITWDPYLKQYFVIRNGTGHLFRYDRDFNYLGNMKKLGKINNDTEGVSYIDGKHLWIVTEANTAHKIEVNQEQFKRGYYQAVKSFRLDGRPAKKNKGLESIAWRPIQDGRKAQVYAAHEGSKRYKKAKMKVVRFNPLTEPGFMSDEVSYTDEKFELVEPFNAEQLYQGIIGDIAGMTFDPTGETLLILSQESRKLLQVDPETGKILSQLKLSRKIAYEGVTIGPNGELVLVAEKDWVHVYQQKDRAKR
jgi:uncharacterized protein YjiK